MRYPYILLAGLIGTLMLALPAIAAEKTIVGWIERVRLYPGDFLVHAKLDSGAEYCSLDASNLQVFERDGKQWVRFELAEKREGNSITIERPLLRNATIKRHNLKSQTRPVIRLGVCLGKIYKETEVNLIDRQGFQYRMLLGRKFMEGMVVIDPSSQYTIEPQCQESAPVE